MRAVLAGLVLLLIVDPTPSAEPALLPPHALVRLGIDKNLINYTESLIAHPDGKSLYCGERIGWWDWNKSESIPSPIKLPAGHTLRRFLPDGSAVTFGQKREHLVDPKTGTVRVTLPRLDFVQIGPQAKFAVGLASVVEKTTLVQADLTAGGVVEAFAPLCPAEGFITKLSLSADGKRVAWLEFERSAISGYDLEKGQPLPRINCKTGKLRDEVNTLALSPDGQTLAALREEFLSLYETATGKCIGTIATRFNDTDDFLRFSPDGKQILYSHCHGGVYRAEVKDGAKAERIPFDMPTGFRKVAWFADGKHVAFVSHPGTLRVFDIASAAQVDPFKHYPPFAGVLALNNQEAISWSRQGLLLLWDLQTGKVLRETRLTPQTADHEFDQMAVSPKGDRLLILDDYRLTLWSIPEGKQIAVLKAKDYHTVGSFSPDGKAIFVGPWHVKEPTLVFDAETGRQTHRFPHKNEYGRAWRESHIHSDGRLWFSSDNENLQAYEVSTGLVRWGHHFGPNTSSGSPSTECQMVSDPTGRSVIFIRHHHTMILNARTGEVERMFPTYNGSHRPHLSPDGRWLVLGHSLYDLHASSAIPPKHLNLPDFGWLTGMSQTPDGKRLLTANASGTCMVWDWPALEKTLLQSPARKQIDAEKLWEQLLLKTDEATAAMRSLYADPELACTLLKAKLKPVPRADLKEVEQWIRDLDNESFVTRNNAQLELSKVKESAEARLRAALKAKPSPEATERLGALINSLEVQEKGAEALRVSRSLEVLETLATPSARNIVERLANGAAGARLTIAARESLQRIGR